MAVNKDFVNYITDQLSGFGSVEVKNMFGGAGIFHKGLMIGMVAGDTFRLKVDEHNRKDYEEEGMAPYYSNNKKKGMPYWEVPAKVLENRDILAIWAAKSYEAALRAKK